MSKITGKEALEHIMNGGIIEFGDRYYRKNPKTKKFEFSDDIKHWKVSNIKVRTIFESDDWNKVE